MSFLGGYFSGWSNILSGVGSALNKLTGVNKQMDKSYQQEMNSMAYQNAYNRQMWDLQNQYNSPTAQLARMREAGIDINPTSYALGTGNLSNTATFVGSENGFSGSGSPAGNPISALMGVASGIQGIRESQARTDNLDVQNENLQVQQAGTRLDNQIKQHNLNIGKNTGMPVGETPGLVAVAGQELAGLRKNPKKLLERVSSVGSGYSGNIAYRLGDKIRSWFEK